MPTGTLNVVCDECFGGVLVFLPTGERQLQHHDNCPHKWREDSFLIQLSLGLPSGKYMPYPDVKLNPIIYDMLCNNQFTYDYHKTFAKRGMSDAQKRSQRVNDMLQLVRTAMIEDGTWPYLHKEWMDCPG